MRLFSVTSFYSVQAQQNQILLENVRILDAKTQSLSPPSHVLITGNIIETISPSPIAVNKGTDIVKINGAGKTLMQA